MTRPRRILRAAMAVATLGLGLGLGLMGPTPASAEASAQASRSQAKVDAELVAQQVLSLRRNIERKIGADSYTGLDTGVAISLGVVPLRLQILYDQRKLRHFLGGDLAIGSNREGTHYWVRLSDVPADACVPLLSRVAQVDIPRPEPLLALSVNDQPLPLDAGSSDFAGACNETAGNTMTWVWGT